MTSGFFTGHLLRGLAVRVLLFLSLALLPIGLIAVVQTREISDQARANAELSLLAVTGRIAGAEERVLQEAFGAAEALGKIVSMNLRNDPRCSQFLREYQQSSGIYTMVGFIGVDGIMSCNSAGEEVDFSQEDSFQVALSEGTRSASAVHRLGAGHRAETVVSVPVFEQKDLAGFMAISIPFDAFSAISEPELDDKPVALLTFNHKGQILTSEKTLDEVAHEVPANVSLAAFSGERPSVFRGLNKQGDERAFAVLPLIPDAVYAVSVWPADTPILRSALSTRLSSLLPVVMWLSSLIVAFWALHRLAITHIRKLGRQMRRFALNRMLPRHTLGSGVPSELVDMERAFVDMAESILRDEATLEDSLRQKNILLKEVHHRVKNNLQLISSIMNMQIRQAKGDDAKFVLRRLQERILSLATVHENMYQNDNLARVDASVLLSASVNQLLSVGLVPDSHVSVKQHYDKIMLEPDDAAPLTLLTSEAVTNALKYVSADADSKPSITVSLTYLGDDMASLKVENSAFAPPTEAGTGLGSKLILAFARQLNGTLESGPVDEVFQVSVTFPVPQNEKPVHDY